MGFQLKNIDHAIEWAIRDEVIARGLWPDQRTFVASGNHTAFDAAVTALTPRIDVFGTGNYKDRIDLQSNNVIIERDAPQPGALSTANPLYFSLNDIKKWDKKKSAPHTWFIEYEVRFVCSDVKLDRSIISIVNKVFPARTFIYGVNDDLTNMPEGFFTQRVGQPVDLSGANYIERVFRVTVVDVDLDLDEDGNPIIDTVSPMIESSIIANVEIPGADVQHPNDINDVPQGTLVMADLFLSFTENSPYFNKLTAARVYAQDTEAKALRNIIPVRSNAINSGLTFMPFKGFVKTSSEQYLLIPAFDQYLTSYFYSVFVTDVPSSGTIELFGLQNGATSFYLVSDSASGLKAKGNSDTELVLTIQAKPNTLYSLNRLDRFVMEIWENDVLLGKLEAPQPTGIPVGFIKELNINNQGGVSVGISDSGGLALSCIGEGFKGRDIVRFYQDVRLYMTKIGLLT